MTQRYLSGRLANAAAVALLALGIPSIAASAPKETERVEKTIPFASAGTLKLKNFSGSVEITGEQRSDIALIAIRTAPRDRLDHIKLDVQSSGDTVTIDANKKDESWHENNDNVVETDFTLRVPATANLDIDVFSSPVTVSGVTGTPPRPRLLVGPAPARHDRTGRRRDVQRDDRAGAGVVGQGPVAPRQDVQRRHRGAAAAGRRRQSRVRLVQRRPRRRDADDFEEQVEALAPRRAQLGPDR